MVGAISVQSELYIITMVLLALIAVSAIFLVRLFARLAEVERKQTKLNKILAGQKTEDVLCEVLKKQRQIEIELEELKAMIARLEEKEKRNLDKVKVVRYNASRDNDAKLSYSIGISNEKEDGLVITGLHYREGLNLYVKQVQEGVSDVPLSEEEKKVLQRSKLDYIIR